ncbi:MAG TPA: hypothetical protein VFC34_08825 [Puia sp.]|nr:hypothetical protein [Puia sp.]
MKAILLLTGLVFFSVIGFSQPHHPPRPVHHPVRHHPVHHVRHHPVHHVVHHPHH